MKKIILKKEEEDTMPKVNFSIPRFLKKKSKSIFQKVDILFLIFFLNLGYKNNSENLTRDNDFCLIYLFSFFFHSYTKID